MTKKNDTSENQVQCDIQNVVCSGYVLRFNEPDSHGNVILPNSFNVKDFEQMKIAGNIIDYEIDDKGVKVIKRVDITSVSI